MQPEYRSAEATIVRPSARDWEIFLEWAGLESWRVPARELQLYRGVLADSAFVLRTGDEAPVGFITTCRHQRSAWIGNLIVDPARRGAGIGRRLFAHAVGTLSARGAATLWLTASAGGLPLYADKGFRETGRVERWVWSGESLVSAKIEPVGKGELFSLTRADATAWDDSRVGLLTLLARGGSIFSAGSSIALLQTADDLSVLGPWLSADLCPRNNRTILTMAMEAVSGRGELAVDVLASSPVRTLLKVAGFRLTGETVLMMRGEPGKVKLGEVVSLASLGSMG
ncbi:MAG: GNAT family N-acetyltransferase [Desulfuromonas sp.]|nr:GNAT family N-acetyltransferase [Desulfuromonas sp.]